MMRIISGKFKNRKLDSPKTMDVRPTSGRLREALFNITQHYIEGADFLDLFAGSGAVGFEALSRGAGSVCFVDSSRSSVRSIEKNISMLGVDDDAYVVDCDVLEFLPTHRGAYDIIYVDPPYQKGYSEKILAMIDGSQLLKPDGVLFIEDSKDFDPVSVPLKQLVLVNSRRLGRSMLHQYKRAAV
ncbi:MAG: 16S rRNA (guanine(966)-N(2))-methyltransferase RsmD [Chlamydiales bacterium]|nr:16S rRNA (guanine(966)-N(2))-methyltransferase RsmD [Chlamydiia bacterium]MCP5507408.1 16S rRNA (guanine(966)-N(2))-methyltransferase RsmD [Chlamydiales bacterium]